MTNGFHLLDKGKAKLKKFLGSQEDSFNFDLKQPHGRRGRKFLLPKSSLKSGEPVSAFTSGYLIFPKVETGSVPNGWVQEQVGEWTFCHDSRLLMSIASENRSTLVALGKPWDSLGVDRVPEEVLKDLLGTLQDRGLGEFEQAVSWLRGRFVLMLLNPECDYVYGDATASRPCFWGMKGERVYLGSHATLVAKALGKTDSTQAHSILKSPDYSSPQGKWLPGTITAHDATSLLAANCVLEIHDGKARHRRFFPFPGYQLPDFDTTAAAAVVASELQRASEVITSATDQVFLAVTAGDDSRMMLLGGIDQYRQAGAIGVTYHSFSKNPEHSRTDLIGANRLCLKLGIPHLILDLTPLPANDSFLKKYYETFRGWARFPALAALFSREFERDGVLLLGIGPEIGTAFYRNRKEKTLSPELLAEKFTSSKIKNSELLRQEFAKYIEYTQLPEKELGGIDFYDLFYWESRLAGWAAVGYSEYELGIGVELPFNSRRIFEAMLALPIEQRVGKTIYKEIHRLLGNL